MFLTEKAYYRAIFYCSKWYVAPPTDIDGCERHKKNHGAHSKNSKNGSLAQKKRVDALLFQPTYIGSYEHKKNAFSKEKEQKKNAEREI